MTTNNVFRNLFLAILLPIALGFFQTASAQTKIEGTYDRTQKKFIPTSGVNSIYDFRDGLANFRTNDKKGIIDTLGNVIVPMKYDEIEQFLDGVARVEIFGDYPTHYGYIDKQGNEVYTTESKTLVQNHRLRKKTESGVSLTKKEKKFFPLFTKLKFVSAVRAPLPN